MEKTYLAYLFRRWQETKTLTVDQLGIGRALIAYFASQCLTFAGYWWIKGVDKMLSDPSAWVVGAGMSFAVFLLFLGLNWVRSSFIIYGKLDAENETNKARLDTRMKRQETADQLSKFMAAGIRFCLERIEPDQYDD